ncbi:MAG TPA: N-acetyltransferase [Chloroflexi bacterium]|jgi:UDP-2-acetamido-3-amino-2,3-dideoxy-glucuronate N-acetyltransferase|nr:N-acetyltransferase [Chloroflexota bacterium]
MMPIRIHPTADVSPLATIGKGSSIWHQAQIREHAVVGRECIISKGVYVDTGVVLGDRVKVQNYVSIYHGVEIEDGVFCGPHCVFTNDHTPRAVDPDGVLKSSDDWELSRTRVCAGASIGANATIVCGVTIGRWAMVGAGAVVTHNVPDYGLVMGNPARLRGFVCACGHRLQAHTSDASVVTARCSACARLTTIPKTVWEMVR